MRFIGLGHLVVILFYFVKINHYMSLRFYCPLMLRSFLFAALSFSSLAHAQSAFSGRWALALPGGRAGWLGVEEKNGTFTSSALWGGGSVTPTASTKVDGDVLIFTRQQKNKEGKVSVETVTAKIAGDAMTLTSVKTNAEGKEIGKPAEFTGKRIPPVPAAPDLSQLKLGAPIKLLNGKDLTGWKLMNDKADNGWSVKDGALINRVVKAKDKHFGNLRTEAEFEDFNLKTEVRTSEGSNSGIYLRGIYEIQIMESFGKPLDSHNMGALYSRITPSVNAEKPIGEWQTLDITLVDRHVTVILNGKTIIDNQPALGCTGGAMTSDEFKPGPIYLQGDHTNVDYRNMVLRPVVR